MDLYVERGPVLLKAYTSPSTLCMASAVTDRRRGKKRLVSDISIFTRDEDPSRMRDKGNMEGYTDNLLNRGQTSALALLSNGC
jgi:hypothetical protein